jgi:hypothetical protein
VQVDPIKPTLKAPGTKRLKLKFEKVLSNFAFKFNLRRYTKVNALAAAETADGERASANAAVTALRRELEAERHRG